MDLLSVSTRVFVYTNTEVVVSVVWQYGLTVEITSANIASINLSSNPVSFPWAVFVLLLQQFNRCRVG